VTVGRHIEKLSPGMCTGWGDLVCARSHDVITSTEPSKTPPSARFDAAFAARL
jgi:hypothetical protein